MAWDRQGKEHRKQHLKKCCGTRSGRGQMGGDPPWCTQKLHPQAVRRAKGMAPQGQKKEPTACCDSAAVVSHTLNKIPK